VLPLARRLAYALADRAERDGRARRVLVSLLRSYFRALAAERRWGGERLLQIAREEAERWAAWRAPRLRRALGLDPQDLGDLLRLQEWEDRVFGIEGHFTERGPRRAVRCETACPFAEAARAAPEICTDVVHRLETATFRALAPSYRLLPLERLLSKGDRMCEFRHQLDDAPTRKIV
jgi:hypothetical protein